MAILQNSDGLGTITVTFRVHGHRVVL